MNDLSSKASPSGILSPEEAAKALSEVRNVPLLRKTVEHLKDAPKDHNQMVWRNTRPTVRLARMLRLVKAGQFAEAEQLERTCGTTACFAGWGAMLDGAVWADVPGDGPYGNGESVMVVPNRQAHSALLRALPESYTASDYSDEVTALGGAHVQDYAMRAFGVTASEANWLFHETRSVMQLERAVDALDRKGHLAEESGFIRYHLEDVLRTLAKA